MTVKQMRVYTQARLMPTDADLCRILGFTPEALERFRAVIERARAEAIVESRFKTRIGEVIEKERPCAT